MYAQQSSQLKLCKLQHIQSKEDPVSKCNFIIVKSQAGHLAGAKKLHRIRSSISDTVVSQTWQCLSYMRECKRYMARAHSKQPKKLSPNCGFPGVSGLSKLEFTIYGVIWRL